MRGSCAQTITGRIIPSDPQIQNIPIGTDEEKHLRDLFLELDSVAADFPAVETLIRPETSIPEA